MGQLTLLLALFAAALDLAGVALPLRAIHGTWPTLAELLTLPGSPAPLMGHLGAVAILATGWWERGRPDAPGGALVLLLTAALGPTGAMTALLAAAVSVLVPSSPLEVEERRGDGARGPQGGAALEPDSLCDVFRHGSLGERRRAVALIGANFRPELAVPLKMALADEHNAIRVQAGLVMQTLEDAFTAEERALRARVREGLGSHGFGDGAGWLKLAELYDARAYAGLLDPGTTAELQQRALDAYTRYLELQPGDLRAHAAVGRLLVRSGAHQAAAHHLLAALERGQVSAGIVMWGVEALYRARRYDDLHRVLDRHGELVAARLPKSSVFRGVIQLWRQRPARPVVREPRPPSAPEHLPPADEDAFDRALRTGSLDG